MPHVHDARGKILLLFCGLSANFPVNSSPLTTGNIAIGETIKWSITISDANDWLLHAEFDFSFFFFFTFTFTRLSPILASRVPSYHFLINFLQSIKRIVARKFTALSAIKAEFYRTAINSRLRAWKERFSLGRWPDIPAYAKHCAYFIRRKYRSIGFE